MFNALRWIARAGAPWQLMPHNIPPLQTVYQQTCRRLAAGCFEAMVHDLRTVARPSTGRPSPAPSFWTGGMPQSTCESGPRAGCDGGKRERSSKMHMGVDTLGLLQAAHVTPVNEQERAQAGELARQVQQVTGQSVKVAFADQGFTGEAAAQDGWLKGAGP